MVRESAEKAGFFLKLTWFRRRCTFKGTDDTSGVIEAKCNSIKGKVENPVIIKDIDTRSAGANVMRLTEDVLSWFLKTVSSVFARMWTGRESCLEVIEDLTDNVEMPVSVTIASGFPKGDKLELVVATFELRLFGPSLPTGLWLWDGRSQEGRSLPRLL